MILKFTFLFTFLLTIFYCTNSFSSTCTGNDFLEYDKQYQISYMAGFWDEAEVRSYNWMIDCVGESAKMSQLADTLINHLKANPQLRHYNCAALAEAAIIKTWNCIPPKPKSKSKPKK